jgi:DNA-binding beta-propeller fold protein YncE
VYVTNYGAARGIDTELIYNVSATDSLTNEIVDTVSVGGMPHAVADNPNNNQIYVSNTVSCTVSVIKPMADNNNPIF